MRQLQKLRIAIPQPLRHHLRHLHGRHCRSQPTIAADHVNDRLQQPRRCLQHLLLIIAEIAGKRRAREVRLQQHVHLCVRIGELGVVDP